MGCSIPITCGGCENKPHIGFSQSGHDAVQARAELNQAAKEL